MLFVQSAFQMEFNSELLEYDMFHRPQSADDRRLSLPQAIQTDHFRPRQTDSFRAVRRSPE